MKKVRAQIAHGDQRGRIRLQSLETDHGIHADGIADQPGQKARAVAQSSADVHNHRRGQGMNRADEVVEVADGVFLEELRAQNLNRGRRITDRDDGCASRDQRPGVFGQNGRDLA